MVGLYLGRGRMVGKKLNEITECFSLGFVKCNKIDNVACTVQNDAVIALKVYG